MKTILKVLIVVFGCASCQSREQMEVASLLGVIFESEIERGDSVYLIKDAVLDWEGYLEGSQCDLEWLEDFFGTNSFNKIEVSSVYSEREIGQICAEIGKSYQFQPTQLHSLISLVPKERIDKMIHSFEENVKRGGPISITEEMDKFRYYEKLSKPIFTKNYRYAIIYRQSVCFPILCVGPVLTIYEKKDGKWKPIAGQNFYLI
ncbi:MAG: hypothetical protein ACXIUD_08845 [Mongoliitalea sp.]